MSTARTASHARLYYRRLGALAASLCLGALVASCRDGEPIKEPADLASFVIKQDFAIVPMCVTSCSTNEDCQNSCPTPSSGISCCDTNTHQCFTAQANMCPAPPDLAMHSPY